MPQHLKLFILISEHDLKLTDLTEKSESAEEGFKVLPHKICLIRSVAIANHRKFELALPWLNQISFSLHVLFFVAFHLT